MIPSSIPHTYANTRPVKPTNVRYAEMRLLDRVGRLAHVFCLRDQYPLRVAAAHSPGAKALYYRRRDHGDRHAAALRNVFNRLIGCLYHCLQTGQTYDETTAFPTPATQSQPTAA